MWREVVKDEINSFIFWMACAKTLQRSQRLLPSLPEEEVAPKLVLLYIKEGQHMPDTMWTRVGGWQTVRMLAFGPMHPILWPKLERTELIKADDVRSFGCLLIESF